MLGDEGRMRGGSNMKGGFLAVPLGLALAFQPTVKLTVVKMKHSEAEGVGIFSFNPVVDVSEGKSIK